jgi:hypothetical protein
LNRGKRPNRFNFGSSSTVKDIESSRVAGSHWAELKIKGGTMIEWTQMVERGNASWISNRYQWFPGIRWREPIVYCGDEIVNSIWIGLDGHAFFEGRRMDIKIHDTAVDEASNRLVGNVFEGDNNFHQVSGFADILKAMGHTEGVVLIPDFRHCADRRTSKVLQNPFGRTVSGIVGPGN